MTTAAAAATRRGWRGWAPWVLIIAVVAAALVVGAQRPGPPATLEGRVAAIATMVRCPVCGGESAEASQSPEAAQIRDTIRTDLQAGESQSQILDQMVASYGPSILERPPAHGLGLTVWVLPTIASLAGAAGLGWLFRRWRRSPAEGAVPLEPTEPPGAAEPVEGPQSTEAPRALPGGPDTGSAASSPSRARRRRTLTAAIAVATGAVVVAAGTTYAVWGGGSSSPKADEAAELAQASAMEARGDGVGALKAYQSVVARDPAQPEALTGEGWLLAQTQQPALLTQGLQLLTRAEKSDPGYGPAHLYRGIALSAEGAWSSAIPELSWYLAHRPDPALVPKVQAALAAAKQSQEAATAGR